MEEEVEEEERMSWDHFRFLAEELAERGETAESGDRASLTSSSGVS